MDSTSPLPTISAHISADFSLYTQSPINLSRWLSPSEMGTPPRLHSTNPTQRLTRRNTGTFTYNAVPLTPPEYFANLLPVLIYETVTCRIVHGLHSIGTIVAQIVAHHNSITASAYPVLIRPCFFPILVYYSSSSESIKYKRFPGVDQSKPNTFWIRSNLYRNVVR